MALKFKWKKNLPLIIWGIIALIFIAILLRLIIWEHNYYTGKEGSSRTAPLNNTIAPEDAENVDENDITNDEKNNYKVAPNKPRFLSIAKLGIDRARIIEVGLNSIGRLQVPLNIFDVGWYRSSGKPGTGGTMLLDGHNGGPTKEGVFKHLPDIQIGDIITIERGDGKFFKYAVVESEEVPLSEADSKMQMMVTSPEKNKESLSIITCTGVWSQVQQTYLSRQFVRAVIVEDNLVHTDTGVERADDGSPAKTEEDEKKENEENSENHENS
ncbi:class F sortase [Candidatus Saccharibacteria bacterium]|nr:class F sortase [Candidatus Saccharibacteria bacterium]